MSTGARRFGPALVIAVLLGLLAPAGASAHAYLTGTAPAESSVLKMAPAHVALSFDEAVDPRFAEVSVTDAAGRFEATGAPVRSPSNPDTLTVGLRRGLARGWYLVYWRAISVDGHPVQGSYTFAVGPRPGAQPQFRTPRLGGSATSADVLVPRWIMLASIMSAVGLWLFRTVLSRGLELGAGRRALNRALVASTLVGLLAALVYLDTTTAVDALRSPFALGTLIPLYGASPSGHAYLELAICFALFSFASWIAIWVDNDTGRRSVAELAAGAGAGLAAAGVLVLPGAGGHPGTTSPRGLSLTLDALHLLAGSLWLGGLTGLALLGRAGVSVLLPRFSRVALSSVLVLFATGVWASFYRLPTFGSLFHTGYGVTILVKVTLLVLALAPALVNRLRGAPRGVLSVEVAVVAAAVFAG
ncbi:MAG: copper resistance protein CopC/CopD, partial [Solirubrobacterales bacterium]|nr:copper resistance protein CopC/CopD [Solirubrobacterales bacterium]